MIEVFSECQPGGKLSKPKQLKGLKPVYSYKWGGVTACQVFYTSGAIWIKHNDWCSKSFYGVDKSAYRHHFGYSDAFTAPTVKGTAYISIDVAPFSVDAPVHGVTAWIRALDAEIYSADSRFCSDDRRMIEDVLIEFYKKQRGKMKGE